jgi:hypothetical protein
MKFIKGALVGLVLTASSMATAGLIITSTVEVTDPTHALDGATFTLTSEIADGAVWGRSKYGALQTALSNERLVITGASGGGTALNGVYTCFTCPTFFKVNPGAQRAAYNLTRGDAPVSFVNDDETISFKLNQTVRSYFNVHVEVGDKVQMIDFGGTGYVILLSLDRIFSLDYRGGTRLEFQPMVSSFVVGTTDVPEPSTLAIFTLGLMGLASRRFKKKS